VILSRRTSLFLLAFTLWSWVIWITFLRNVWQDARSWNPSGGPTAFLTVHVVLVVASLVLGTLIGVIGWRGFMASRKKTHIESSAEED
jgi:hypothetical protein